ncbi:hypothetical protein GS500_05555 [Rhodococcus hoagii]|nr:hypothetical protein [Prescottella equi]
MMGPVLSGQGAGARWTMPALHAELARIRARKGVAFETVATGDGTEMLIVGSVGCAVRSKDGAAVSLSVAGDAHSIHPDRLAPLVREGRRRAGEDRLSPFVSCGGTSAPQSPDS